MNEPVQEEMTVDDVVAAFREQLDTVMADLVTTKALLKRYRRERDEAHSTLGDLQKRINVLETQVQMRDAQETILDVNGKVTAPVPEET